MNNLSSNLADLTRNAVSKATQPTNERQLQVWEQKRLRELLTETGVLRILRFKPAKVDSNQAIKGLSNDIEHILRTCDRGYNGMAKGLGRFVLSANRRAKLKLLLEDCQQRIEELREAERRQEEARTRAAAAVEQYASA